MMGTRFPFLWLPNFKVRAFPEATTFWWQFPSLASAFSLLNFTHSSRLDTHSTCFTSHPSLLFIALLSSCLETQSHFSYPSQANHFNQGPQNGITVPHHCSPGSESELSLPPILLLFSWCPAPPVIKVTEARSSV